MQISGRSLAAALVVTASLGSWQPTPQAWLIQRENLVYTGAFRLPRGADTQHSFEYGGTALAFNPAHATLLLVGHDWHQRVAEIDIPEARQGASLAELSTATLRQPFTDVLAGRLGAVGPGAKIGGLLPFGDQLLVSAYVYYDATRSQAASHYLSSLDFARVADVKGPYTIGSSQAGFVAGYMTMIPPEWQAPFGGIALTGQCCLSIISRTSLGPSLTVFSPSDVGTKTKVAGRMVLGYPIEHPALGDCYGKGGTLFNCAVIMGGVVFPPGTGSLFLHRGSVRADRRHRRRRAGAPAPWPRAA